ARLSAGGRLRHRGRSGGGPCRDRRLLTTPPQFWYDIAMALRNDATDAYFISCANIQSIDVIDDLERDLSNPVVTSNQAALWCSLRAAGIRDVVPGLGTLLRHNAGTRSAAA